MAGGRVVIPAVYRRALDLHEGDDLILWLDDGELRITTPALAIARAQALIRQYIPEGRSLSEELLADRRAEAARE